MIGAVGKAGIIDPLDARIGAQEVRDLGRVLDMPFDAQRHRFDALQQQEGIERRQNGSHGALIDAARTLNVGAGAELLGVDQPVIGGVGLVEGGKAAGVFRPGKAAAVNDRAAEGGAVAAEKFRQRMNGDIGAVVERLEQDRGCDRVVDDQRYAVAMGDLRQRLDIADIAGRIADGLRRK